MTINYQTQQMDRGSLDLFRKEKLNMTQLERDYDSINGMEE